MSTPHFFMTLVPYFFGLHYWAPLIFLAIVDKFSKMVLLIPLKKLLSAKELEEVLV